MGEKTNIEWADSTVNPTGFQCCGCELWNHENKFCYSGTFEERLHGHGAFSKPVQLKPGQMARAALWSDLKGKERKDKPWLNGRPRVIFLGDMADVLQPAVPFEYLKSEIIDVVRSDAGRRHVWMLLTKQSSRLEKFSDWLSEEAVLDWPDNLWPGVSVTTQSKSYRIEHLLNVPSDNRFVSYEPAWELVDFNEWSWEGYKDEEGLSGVDPSYEIRLIIMGGQSGQGAKPFNVDWAKQTREFCEDARIDFFLKQLGSNCITDNANMQDWPEGTVIDAEGFGGFAAGQVMLKHKKGGDMLEWPEELRVREFP